MWTLKDSPRTWRSSCSSSSRTSSVFNWIVKIQYIVYSPLLEVLYSLMPWSYWPVTCFNPAGGYRPRLYCHGFARALFLRGDAHGKLTYLKCKPVFDYSDLQFQTSSISRQITPGISFSVLSTSLTIQPVESIVQGLDLMNLLIIGIIWHKLNKLSTYVPNKVGEKRECVNIDFSFYK